MARDASFTPTIHALGRAVRGASDSQLLKIAAVVDAQRNRDQLDDLVAGIRPRLVRLRPPRPLRLERLLFTPLDPVIVPRQRWRPHGATVPISAIRPIAATVRQAMGPAAEAIEAMIAGRSTRHVAVVKTAGAALWPAAARILANPPASLLWETSGLALSVYQPLVRRVATILAQATAIETLARHQADGFGDPPIGAIVGLLRAATEADAESLQTMLVILLSRLPDSAALVVSVAAGVGSAEGTGRRALRQAAGAIMRGCEDGRMIETRVEQASIADAAEHARQMIGLLRALEEGKTQGERERARAVRARLDQGCQARFSDGLTHELLGSLADVTDAEIAVPALEDVARDLRALETEARAIGGGPVYDRLLHAAADTVGHASLALMDRVRLTEIIAGTDVAMKLLTEER